MTDLRARHGKTALKQAPKYPNGRIGDGSLTQARRVLRAFARLRPAREDEGKFLYCVTFLT